MTDNVIQFPEKEDTEITAADIFVAVSQLFLKNFDDWFEDPFLKYTAVQILGSLMDQAVYEDEARIEINNDELIVHISDGAYDNIFAQMKTFKDGPEPQLH